MLQDRRSRATSSAWPSSPITHRLPPATARLQPPDARPGLRAGTRTRRTRRLRLGRPGRRGDRPGAGRTLGQRTRLVVPDPLALHDRTAGRVVHDDRPLPEIARLGGQAAFRTRRQHEPRAASTGARACRPTRQILVSSCQRRSKPPRHRRSSKRPMEAAAQADQSRARARTPTPVPPEPRAIVYLSARATAEPAPR
jgi:hypothetical protein